MMLYTIMPLEMVLEGNDDVNVTYKEIPLPDGDILMVEPTGLNTARVVRLISSNPSHYLNP